MFGFFIGTACLIGLVAVARRGRHHRYFGRWGHGGRFLLHRVLRRLDTTPGQEKVIREAIHDFREDAFGLRSDVRGTRSELARALRAPELDKALLESIFDKHDEVIEKLRASAVDTAEKVHTTLDAQQRQRLADIIESGPFGYANC